MTISVGEQKSAKKSRYRHHRHISETQLDTPPCEQAAISAVKKQLNAQGKLYEEAYNFGIVQDFESLPYLNFIKSDLSEAFEIFGIFLNVRILSNEILGFAGKHNIPADNLADTIVSNS